MKRKGSFDISMNMVIHIIVLLAISGILFIILNGRATGTESVIKSTDSSLGNNGSKTFDCTKKCNDTPTGAACITDIDPQMKQTCRQFLDNQLRAIEPTYPPTIGLGPNTITITLKNDDGAAIQDAAITGDGSFNCDNTGKCDGTIDTTGNTAGYVKLTASAPGYALRPITILVDSGAQPIVDIGSGSGSGSGGGTGGTTPTPKLVITSDKTSINVYETTTVKFTVKDSAGKIISEANVILDGGGCSNMQSAKSGTDGTVSFTIIAKMLGNIKAKATKTGYSDSDWVSISLKNPKCLAFDSDCGNNPESPGGCYRFQLAAGDMRCNDIKNAQETLDKCINAQTLQEYYIDKNTANPQGCAPISYSSCDEYCKNNGRSSGTCNAAEHRCLCV